MSFNFFSSKGIPSGFIGLWHGTVASIPTGWYLCNGSNGTPDLRSRFILGAGGSSDPGETGGGMNHTHGALPNQIEVQSGTGAYVWDVTGSGVDYAEPQPLYYALAYIMKA